MDGGSLLFLKGLFFVCALAGAMGHYSFMVCAHERRYFCHVVVNTRVVLFRGLNGLRGFF